jgi:deoxyribose-phosphate aldolase
MIYKSYNINVNVTQLSEKIELLAQRSENLVDKKVLSHIFSLIDLTSLNAADTEKSIIELTEKVNKVGERFPELPNVAAICVYPTLVSAVRDKLKDKKIKIVSVAGSFPASQTFLEVKLLEVEKVIQEGANEVDVVISLGKFLQGEYKLVSDELSRIKETAGNIPVKVILETGLIEDMNLIKLASFLALEAGADFIKTSTGKVEKGASPDAVWVMCEAIREYAQKSGRAAGIKPAGGISDIKSALHYYQIVVEILGNDWLKPERFRFGASKLTNLLLGEKYF